jgi:hypothetical protein
VVSDQSKTTQINFGDGKEGLDTYPLTILIDQEGLIKWIGEPMELSDNIMDDFLAGELKGVNLFQKEETVVVTEEKKTEVAKEPSDFQRYIKMIQNEKLLYYFDFRIANDPVSTQSKIDNKIINLSSMLLTEIYAELFGIASNSIELPADLDTMKYTLLYKNLNANEGSIARLENEILQALGLVKENKQLERIINLVTVKDVTKLKPALETLFASRSEAGDKIVYTGTTIKDLVVDINEVVEGSYEYTGSNEDKYDFIIAIDSKENLQASLAFYGLELLPQTKLVDIVSLAPKG